MYKKIYERKKSENDYLKGYEFKNEINILNLIELINNSNYKITNIHIYEKGDMGSKVFEGGYSLETFYTKYESIDKSEIDGFRIDLESGCSIFIMSDRILTLSAFHNIELDSIIPNVNGKSL